MVDHEPPAPFPTVHFTAVAVPQDFARVVSDAAEKSGVLFGDQLLMWAQMGAEHSRLCGPKPTRTRRTK